MNNFNQLTPAQAERLAVLSEELGEAQQAIGKILRHGYKSHHPNIPEITNRNSLEKELGDITFAISMLASMDDINYDKVTRYAFEKQSKIRKYLHHQ